MSSILQRIVFDFEDFLSPLSRIAASDDPLTGLRRFLRIAGWRMTSNIDPLPIVTAIDVVTDAVIAALDGVKPNDLEQFIEALEGVRELVFAIENLVDLIARVGPSQPEPEDIEAFAKDILHLLVVSWLQRKPVIGDVANMFGLIESVEVPARTLGGWLECRQRSVDRLRPNAISTLIDDPVSFIKSYTIPNNWENSTDAAATNLLLATWLQPLFARFGGRWQVHPDSIASSNDVENSARLGLIEVVMPFADRDGQLSFGTEFEMFAAADANEVGQLGPAVEIAPFGGYKHVFDFNSWIFESSVMIALGGVDVGDSPPLLRLSSSGIEAAPSLDLQLGIGAGIDTNSIIGGNRTRLELRNLNIKVFGTITDSDWDVGIGMVASTSRLTLSAEDLGTIVDTVASGFDTTLELDLGIKWSKAKGVTLVAAGGLELYIAEHVTLGPLEIKGLLVGIKFKDSDIDFYMGCVIKVNLGPLVATIENIGLISKLGFSDSRGNLGSANFTLGLKPPNGVGLSIDTSAVKGGGYLFFDFDREEYAGALELIISEWIALKAIGLITTKLPDSSKGFSLLIIITAEFGTGLQLGFGFTLLGVGGLLGLNRTVKIEPLAEGVRSGAAQNIMFPQDVVANAPRIISDLKKFFPTEKDLFLIGPMAKIGYGTPTLISLSLGVIIEVPKVTITILGVLKASLPDEKAEVLKLQVNFIGRIEPSNSLLWFYAELFESRILFITLEGGMGLMVNWGNQSNFVVSVGGFHPRYEPPPLPFPEPPRLAISLLNESYAKIRIEGYFAVTSNTVQFGAKADVFFGFSEFKVEGYFVFDALFQFSPFYFIFEFAVGMSVKVFGIGLFTFSVSGSLEGPSKWHVKGYAKKKVTFLGPTIKVRIDESWGEERQTELPPIAILPLLKKEFEALTNWEAAIPASSSILVSLRKLGEPDASTTEESDNNKLVLHPVVTLRISQRKIPLDLVLEKFGNQRPEDVNHLTVSASISGGTTLAAEDVKEKFATGEFKKLGDTEKLSRPGFELYESGIAVKPEGNQLRTSMAVKRIIRYETIIIDNNFKRHVIPFFIGIFIKLYATLFGHLLNGNAVTKSVLSQHYKNQVRPIDKLIRLIPEEYSVVSVDTNKPVANDAIHFGSHAQAMDYMQEQISQNPHAVSQMHVIPNTEVDLAA